MERKGGKKEAEGKEEETAGKDRKGWGEEERKDRGKIINKQARPKV